jgi:dephospho-CoA kinase
MNNEPKLIGLTGGIGSGKSTVSKIFKSLGVPVFNSDLEAKKIINTNPYVVKAIESKFGAVYINGVLDAKKMAAIVFKDKTSLQQLNEIVHPKVKEAFEGWIKQHEDEKFLIKEAAILIEVGAYKDLDKIILVTAPKDVKIKRVVARDGVQAKDVIIRMDAQLSDKEKLKLVDFVINNDEKEPLIPQVLHIYTQLLLV